MSKLGTQATAGRIIEKGSGDGTWTKIAGAAGGLNIYTEVLAAAGTKNTLIKTR